MNNPFAIEDQQTGSIEFLYCISDHSPSAAATIFSDDHGKTWQAGDVAVPNEGAFGNPNETMLAPLSDGSVMLVTLLFNSTFTENISIASSLAELPKAT